MKIGLKIPVQKDTNLYAAKQNIEMFYRSSYFILLSPFYKIYLFGHAIMYKTTYNFFSSQQCNRNKAVKNIGHVKFNFCRIL